MLTRPLHHIRQNVVAYLALFVALGGTSYATLALPAGSVGSRQIRNHSITAVKLDPRSIAGSIKAWADLQATPRGIVAVRSSSKVHVLTLSNGEGVFWLRRRFSASCIPLVTPQVTGFGLNGYVTVNFTPKSSSVLVVGRASDGTTHPQAAFVAIVCP